MSADPFYLKGAPRWYRVAFAVTWWVVVAQCLALIAWCVWILVTGRAS